MYVRALLEFNFFLLNYEEAYTMADFFYETLQKKDGERCMFIV